MLVFSKTHCPFCRRVKALFDELDVAHEVVELDLRRTSLDACRGGGMAALTEALVTEDGAEIQALLATLTGQRTVPSVFVKGQHIGGCDATLELHASNKLLPLLQ